MRIVHLSPLLTILIDCIAWAIIQPTIAYLVLQVPGYLLDHRSWLFRTRSWEREGRLYQSAFLVRYWKRLLPSGGALFQKGFSLKTVVSSDPQYLRRWITETSRAELCHWVAIGPSVLFFLWNPVAAALLNILYAALFNLPLVIIQRYNRPRLLAIVERTDGMTPGC